MTESEHSPPAIIFDFGGVLMDWNPRYLYRKLFKNEEEAMERFLDEIGFVAWNNEQDKTRVFAPGVIELAGRFPHHAPLIRAFDERWEETVGGAIEPTVALLSKLKEAGHALYGLSNWSADTFSRIRSRYPFFEWFACIILS